MFQRPSWRLPRPCGTRRTMWHQKQKQVPLCPGHCPISCSFSSSICIAVVFHSLSTEPPHINGSEDPIEVSVIVNNLLELTCVASGIPVPKISWMKDGRPLPQKDQVQTLEEGQILRIANAQVRIWVQPTVHSQRNSSFSDL